MAERASAAKLRKFAGSGPGCGGIRVWHCCIWSPLPEYVSSSLSTLTRLFAGFIIWGGAVNSEGESGVLANSNTSSLIWLLITSVFISLSGTPLAFVPGRSQAPPRHSSLSDSAFALGPASSDENIWMLRIPTVTISSADFWTSLLPALS